MKNVTTKLLFGSIIVILLLILYFGLLVYSVHLAFTAPKSPTDLRPELRRTLATVGGLVSALVISELAVTPPKQSPGVRLLVAPDQSEPDQVSITVVKFVAWTYIGIWIALGSAAFLTGELLFPGKVPTLTTYAQAWLGLAVAAGYGYFGLQPPAK